MLFRLIRKVARDQRGATAVEYGIILAVIVLTMVTALAGVATTTTGMWNNISDKVNNAH
ncbi:Flp family type IVb pilin [Sphingomonas immobilis]|uniref:Flp family type IVb pilin n=1 Tax=Sphingomonas immobilis TaxID=3063997 RepID=A0ABT9A1V2_9SPHN|nr:Flp family type IVb pilin [Sphingomonas sp. CA1-15]MDO7842976.1 Flp family type IVb pilin [Sphingomonas sp. CA1-15]